MSCLLFILDICFVGHVTSSSKLSHVRTDRCRFSFVVRFHLMQTIFERSVNQYGDVPCARKLPSNFDDDDNYHDDTH
jgi:hypothetical protein